MTLTPSEVRRLNKFWKPFGMKFCNNCGTTKDFQQFSKMRENLSNRCKNCMSEYRTQNYESISKATTKYRAANADKVQAQYAAYNKAHKEERRAYSAAYRESRPGISKTNSAKYRAGGRDPNKPWPRLECGYEAAHSRVKAIRGPACNHLCPCGERAEDWAYNHQDADEFSGPVQINGKTYNLRWSGDPGNYMPMCRPCHRNFDKKEVSA